MFHDGDLQSGVALAVQESKAVLCFVHDDTETSVEWEAILNDKAQISQSLASQAVALRLQAGSQEAAFLTPICAVNSPPAIIVIRNAQVETNLQSAEISVKQLKTRLASAFGIQLDGDEEIPPELEKTSAAVPESVIKYLDLQPQPGQMRLPNNAYEALENYTQNLVDEGKSPSDIYETQLSLLNNIPIFKDEVIRLRSDGATRELSEYARSRLLRLPAVGLRIPRQKNAAPTSSGTTTSEPPATISNQPSLAQAGERVYHSQNRATASSSTTPLTQARTGPPPQPAENEASEKQKAQRAEYIRMQRDREQTALAERERIKAQIKADRDERRRLDELRKQAQNPNLPTNSEPPSLSTSTNLNSSNADIRIQVRTFDGSTLRTTFSPPSNITSHVRPWIDSASSTTTPYNLKLILTPHPNRTIEAGEEDTSLSDLGIRGSCTLVMVPVKGYVDSYSSAGGGLMGQSGLLGGVGGMVSGGYSLVSGTAGWALGGVKSLLGYGAGEQQGGQTLGGGGVAGEGNAGSSSSAPNVRIRTLADQRAEAVKKDQQFYNGNTLNFEPNKKDDDSKKD